MTTEYYYKSPLGCLEIIGDNEKISSINFLAEEKINSQEDFSEVIKKCVEEFDAYFEGHLKDFTFPFEQKGTDFQQKVWRGLLEVPYGKTESYMALSRRLGDVKAIRAVGTSNGKNKLAIVVPCHRVIGSDGSLTGYAGGLWRKQWLLEHEQKFSGNENKQLGLF
jgi:methylated-DNA-[protein]-cysteine S-methyltransferase